MFRQKAIDLLTVFQELDDAVDKRPALNSEVCFYGVDTTLSLDRRTGPQVEVEALEAAGNFSEFAMENGPVIVDLPIYKVFFISVVMLVYQRIMIINECQLQ